MLNTCTDRRYLRTVFLLAVLGTMVALTVVSSTPIARGGSDAGDSSGSDRHYQADDGNKLSEDLETRLAGQAPGTAVPVLVQFYSAPTSDDLGRLRGRAGDFKVTTQLRNTPAFASTLTAAQVASLAADGAVKSVELDAPVHAMLATATRDFGVQKARQDFAVDGDGNGNATSYTTSEGAVAIIDTGIDAAHVDLDGGKVVAWQDWVGGSTTPYDDNSHGTHVASIAAGTGEGNVANIGVAPGAPLVGAKVLDQRGSGSMSNVAAAVDWVTTLRKEFDDGPSDGDPGVNVRALNLSLGTSGSSDGKDTASVAVNNALAAGIVPAVAAGNSGPKIKTIGSPGAARDAVTVGAQADPGELGFFQAYWSSRGPTADPVGTGIKPDISAPGFNITAADAGTGTGYVTYSGTSMATPFIAGVAALMADANPALSSAGIKAQIQANAVDWGATGKDTEFGSGRLDGYEAIDSASAVDGTGPVVPGHAGGSQTLATAGSAQDYPFTTRSLDPVAVTMIMTNWKDRRTPDFDAYLFKGVCGGTQLAASVGTTRQETVKYQPTASDGTDFCIRIKSYRGTGPYTWDRSSR